jgi:hypothetical protein
MWGTLSGARFSVKNNQEYYGVLKSGFKEYRSPFKKQIKLDLARTFMGNGTRFKEEDIQKMKNVLSCYAK